MTTTTTDTAAREKLFSLLHPIFADCCDPDAVRHDLATPFIQAVPALELVPSSLHVYATDGRILVRCPVTPALFAACGAVEARAKRPLAAKMIAEFAPFDFATPYPAPDTSGLKVCRRCQGANPLPKWMTYDPGLLDEDGDCGLCHGLNIDDPFSHEFPIGPCLLAARYAQILDRHKATLFVSTVDPEKSAIRFVVSPDIEGFVMPIDPAAHGRLRR